jgi:hypothetical protein
VGFLAVGAVLAGVFWSVWRSYPPAREPERVTAVLYYRGGRRVLARPRRAFPGVVFSGQRGGVT